MRSVTLPFRLSPLCGAGPAARAAIAGVGAPAIPPPSLVTTAFCAGAAAVSDFIDLQPSAARATTITKDNLRICDSSNPSFERPGHGREQWMPRIPPAHALPRLVHG